VQSSGAAKNYDNVLIYIKVRLIIYRQDILKGCI